MQKIKHYYLLNLVSWGLLLVFLPIFFISVILYHDNRQQYIDNMAMVIFANAVGILIALAVLIQAKREHKRTRDDVVYTVRWRFCIIYFILIGYIFAAGVINYIDMVDGEVTAYYYTFLELLVYFVTGDLNH